MSSDQTQIISCTCQAFAQFQGLSQEALWANLPRMAEGEAIPFSSFMTGIRMVMCWKRLQLLHWFCTAKSAGARYWWDYAATLDLMWDHLPCGPSCPHTSGYTFVTYYAFCTLFVWFLPRYGDSWFPSQKPALHGFLLFYLNFLACHCRFSVVKHAYAMAAMAAWPRNLQKPELFKVCRQIGRLAEGSPKGSMM